MIPSVEALLEIGYFSLLDVHLARSLAQIAGSRSPLELLGAATASRYTMHGHTCAPILSLSEKPIAGPTGAQKLSWPESGQWRSILEKSPLVHCSPERFAQAPLVYESGRLYLARYWLYEKSLARAIISRSKNTVDGLDKASLKKNLDLLFSNIPDDAYSAQKRAAQVALERTLAIITGGPGTGKTYTVTKILVLIFQQAMDQGKPTPRVSLLAPTGKAAQRLEQSIRQALKAESARLKYPQGIKELLENIPAGTIHRALGFNPRTPTRFRHNEKNPLDADVVMVDEASMVDLPLMSKLFDAVDDEARLILLGDKDQLVSVEVGAVLGDICNQATYTSKQLEMFSDVEGCGIENCIVNLTHSFRFSDEQGIGLLARAINAGDVTKTLEYLSDKKYPEVSLLEPNDNVSIAELVSPMIKNGYWPLLTTQDPEKRLESMGKFRILCAHRRGPTGSETIDALAQNVLNLRPRVGTDQLWRDGQLIMITANDYQLELFNGDVGIVCKDKLRGNILRAFFPYKKTSFLPSRLPRHETVFAMTIHKSQGSEYDNVVVLLPREDSPIVTRELLYTAVSRAKKSVVIIASRNSVIHATRTPVVRTSGLAHAICM